MLIERIYENFRDSVQAKEWALDSMAANIAEATNRMVAALSDGKKILACGNGGSAADAQHFAAELVGRFERERPGLAALALTTDSSILTAVGNDYGFDNIFSKQVQALGQAGDILLAISTSGNSNNVLAAIRSAQERDINVIALTGKGGGVLAEILGENDIHLCVPHNRTARIQEVHLLTIHCLCDGIDHLLLGNERQGDE